MTNDSVVDALFANGGVIRVRTLEELIDVTSLIDAQPIPNGSRVAIVGNAGGPLILAADAAEASDLTVPVLSDELQQRVRFTVSDAAATANPVDLLATVSGAQLVSVLDLLGASNEVDAIVTVPLRAGAGSLGASATGAGQHDLELGLELIVGASRSERYGPLLLVGAGGTAAEILGDRTTLLAPASHEEIVSAIQQLRIAPLLVGYRDPLSC
jgi:acyl-CoA synthetase (NDP forming)